MKTNYEVRYAAHPEDVKHYDTEKLRTHYHIGSLFAADQVNMVYTMHDRMIAGGAMPVQETLALEAIDILCMPCFLSRREIGIFNVGGEGCITVDGKVYPMTFKEALYLGRGDRSVTFRSVDPANPARFYFNSTPAHTTYPDKHVTRQSDGVVVMAMGTAEECNLRTINRMLVNQVLPTCQLQMGMTELAPGSTWNTMPAHTHNRRMEVYFYFELPEGHAVSHFMGEPAQTRHIWMKGNEAVISPEWSIHAACATHNYTFIWGMGGENLDCGDMDALRTDELK